MLRNFSVAAVVYDLPALDAVPQFAALGTPVIVLASRGEQESPGVSDAPAVGEAAGVIVLPRDTAAAVVAAAILQRTVGA